MRRFSVNSTAAKKAHTDKNVVVVNRHSRKVAYLSPTQAGKKHDKKVADEASLAYPLFACLGKDTGFQGYEPSQVISYQPTKKPKGQPLTVQAKFLNALYASTRIIVEHVLSGVKRCRIVKDVLRNTKPAFSDSVMEIACALHNLRSHVRHPVLSHKLIDLVVYSE